MLQVLIKVLSILWNLILITEAVSVKQAALFAISTTPSHGFVGQTSPELPIVSYSPFIHGHSNIMPSSTITNLQQNLNSIFTNSLKKTKKMTTTLTKSHKIGQPKSQSEVHDFHVITTKLTQYLKMNLLDVMGDDYQSRKTLNQVVDDFQRRYERACLVKNKRTSVFKRGDDDHTEYLCVTGNILLDSEEELRQFIELVKLKQFVTDRKISNEIRDASLIHGPISQSSFLDYKDHQVVTKEAYNGMHGIGSVNKIVSTTIAADSLPVDPTIVPVVLDHLTVNSWLNIIKKVKHERILDEKDFLKKKMELQKQFKNLCLEDSETLNKRNIHSPAYCINFWQAVFQDLREEIGKDLMKKQKMKELIGKKSQRYHVDGSTGEIIEDTYEVVLNDDNESLRIEVTHRVFYEPKKTFYRDKSGATHEKFWYVDENNNVVDGSVQDHVIYKPQEVKIIFIDKSGATHERTWKVDQNNHVVDGSVKDRVIAKPHEVKNTFIDKSGVTHERTWKVDQNNHVVDGSVKDRVIYKPHELKHTFTDKSGFTHERTWMADQNNHVVDGSVKDRVIAKPHEVKYSFTDSSGFTHERTWMADQNNNVVDGSVKDRVVSKPHEVKHTFTDKSGFTHERTWMADQNNHVVDGSVKDRVIAKPHEVKRTIIDKAGETHEQSWMADQNNHMVDGSFKDHVIHKPDDQNHHSSPIVPIIPVVPPGAIPPVSIPPVSIPPVSVPSLGSPGQSVNPSSTQNTPTSPNHPQNHESSTERNSEKGKEHMRSSENDDNRKGNGGEGNGGKGNGGKGNGGKGNGGKGNGGKGKGGKGKEPIQHEPNPPTDFPKEGQPGYPGHEGGTPGHKKPIDPSPGSINQYVNQYDDYVKGSSMDKAIYEKLPENFSEAEKQRAIKVINEAADQLRAKNYKGKERGVVHSFLRGKEGTVSKSSKSGRLRDYRNAGNHDEYKDPYIKGGPKEVFQRLTDFSEKYKDLVEHNNRDLGNCGEGAAVVDYIENFDSEPGEMANVQLQAGGRITTVANCDNCAQYKNLIKDLKVYTELAGEPQDVYGSHASFQDVLKNIIKGTVEHLGGIAHQSSATNPILNAAQTVGKGYMVKTFLPDGSLNSIFIAILGDDKVEYHRYHVEPDVDGNPHVVEEYHEEPLVDGKIPNHGVSVEKPILEMHFTSKDAARMFDADQHNHDHQGHSKLEHASIAHVEDINENADDNHHILEDLHDMENNHDYNFYNNHMNNLEHIMNQILLNDYVQVSDEKDSEHPGLSFEDDSHAYHYEQPVSLPDHSANEQHYSNHHNDPSNYIEPGVAVGESTENGLLEDILDNLLSHEDGNDDFEDSSPGLWFTLSGEHYDNNHQHGISHGHDNIQNHDFLGHSSTNRFESTENELLGDILDELLLNEGDGNSDLKHHHHSSQGHDQHSTSYRGSGVGRKESAGGHIDRHGQNDHHNHHNIQPESHHYNGEGYRKGGILNSIFDYMTFGNHHHHQGGNHHNHHQGGNHHHHGGYHHGDNDHHHGSYHQGDNHHNEANHGDYHHGDTHHHFSFFNHH